MQKLECRNGTNLVVYAERKCSSSLVLFFLVVVAILSSVKKPPRSRWNQSASLSFRSSVGKGLRKDKRARAGGRQRKRTAGDDDSALFYLGVFHLFFSSLFPPLCLPYLTNSPSRSRQTERKKPLPSFCSFSSLTSNKKKE